jgi:hypothetical protein
MRTQLLSVNDINEWHTLKNFKLGIELMGEYRMGSEWCKILITDLSDKIYINFGNLGFSNINQSNNFFLSTSNGKYLILQWMFYKVHQHSTPVLIDLESITFRLIDSKRLLYINKIWSNDRELFAQFEEVEWINSNKKEKLVIEKIDVNEMQPLEEFFNLNTETLKVQIFNWIDKDHLQITIR